MSAAKCNYFSNPPLVTEHVGLLSKPYPRISVLLTFLSLVSGQVVYVSGEKVEVSASWFFTSSPLLRSLLFSVANLLLFLLALGRLAKRYGVWS